MPKLDPTAAIEWMTKREAARVKHDEWADAAACAKEMGDDAPEIPASFSDDPIISAWRFCNVRREDDRVTVWIRKNIREQFAGHPDLWLMLAIARQVNWTPTLTALMGMDFTGKRRLDSLYYGAWPGDTGFSPENLSSALGDLASMGLKVYTGAYIISAPSAKGSKKTDYTALEVIGKLWEDRDGFRRVFEYAPQFKKLRAVHERLSSHKGWGPFLAYQAVVDMRFTPLLSDACDVATWAAAGPGTLRGLNRLWGRPVGASNSQAGALAEMRKLEPALRETGIAFDFSDVPNILCETDKFLRVRNGEGTPRAKYVPGRGH